MSVLSIHPPFGGDLPGESIHDNHWTLSGDLREYIDLPDESTNYVIAERLTGQWRNIPLDPEYSCFFAYPETEAAALLLRDEVLRLVQDLADWNAEQSDEQDTPDVLGAAVFDADEAFAYDTWSTVGPALTCAEANALVALFRAVGLDGHADNLAAAHADGDDDPTDEHFKGK